MKRRQIVPETKITAVIEELSGESSMADIHRQYQISESLYYRWGDKFWEGETTSSQTPGLSYATWRAGEREVSMSGAKSEIKR